MEKDGGVLRLWVAGRDSTWDAAVRRQVRPTLIWVRVDFPDRTVVELFECEDPDRLLTWAYWEWPGAEDIVPLLDVTGQTSTNDQVAGGFEVHAIKDLRTWDVVFNPVGQVLAKALGPGVGSVTLHNHVVLVSFVPSN